MNDADSEVMERGYRKIDSSEGVDVIILKRIIKYCVPGILLCPRNSVDNFGKCS